jgi:hypothetical protein
VGWGDVAQEVEPEDRKLGENAPLIGDARRKNVVECRDAIRGHNQEAVAEMIHIPNLAARVALQAGEIGVQNDPFLCGVHG